LLVLGKVQAAHMQPLCIGSAAAWLYPAVLIGVLLLTLQWPVARLVLLGGPKG
jgi:hypothetical protein